MAGQPFLVIAGNRIKQLFGIQTSAGAADAGKIPALDSTGRFDTSMLPVGIGANTITSTASEALAAGAFVNFFLNGAAWGVRNADSGNNRRADGYVTTAVASAGTATVYPLGGDNANLSGLTIGTEYFLGAAGATTATPPTASGTTWQNLGIAKSATELITQQHEAVLL